jgi:hypothetical protein
MADSQASAKRIEAAQRRIQALGSLSTRLLAFGPWRPSSALSSGTINLTGALPDLAHRVTIQGPGANNLTVSGGGYSVFLVQSTVSISGLTVTGGTGYAGDGGDAATSSARSACGSMPAFARSTRPSCAPSWSAARTTTSGGWRAWPWPSS